MGTRRQMLLCARLSVACAISLSIAAAAVSGATLSTTRVASGLARPVSADSPPGDTSRLFIVEQAGVIRILDLTTNTLLETPFLDINALVINLVNNSDERGLLGLTFDPNYDQNGFFYVNYVNNSQTSTVARYTVSADPNVANPASAVTIITYAQPFANHNAGWMDFSPIDGYLYVSTGDGGSGCDPGQRAQDITGQLLGKMLRLDVSADAFPADANKFYTNPPTNPFVGTAGDDELWAYGLRNPWRCSFDRATGALYIADVGQNSREEINFQPPTSNGGENYGWDCREGTSCSNSVSAECVGTTNGCTCGAGGFTDPIHFYTHSLGASITGGYVYRGCRIPGLQGTYFFADYATARIWTFEYSGTGSVPAGDVILRTAHAGGTEELVHASAINQISSFAEDEAGEIYIIDRGSGVDGQIFKIVALNDRAGDIDADGIVNEVDAGILVQVLLGNDPGDPAFTCRADVNGDGLNDGNDIQALVDEL